MIKLVGLAVSLILVGLVSHGFAKGENEPCTNPAGRSGRCVSVNECPILSKLATAPVISINDNEFLKMSKCGPDADRKTLVCCAEASPKLGSRLLKPPGCGQDMGKRSVLNESDEHPWIAQIQYRKPNGKTSLNCGGVLISSRYIITAAHCIKGVPKNWTLVGARLGQSSLTTDVKDCVGNGCAADAPLDFAVEKIIVHEDYNGTTKTMWNDIAMIRLNRDVPFSDSIQPICLPVDEDVRSRNHVGTTAISAGWDRIGSGKIVKKQNIIDPNSCSTVYKQAGITLLDSQLCAADLQSGNGCSLGGSPLVKRIGSDSFLVGVVSFGQAKCNTNTIPDVYSNLAKYVDWVQSKSE